MKFMNNENLAEKIAARNMKREAARESTAKAQEAQGKQEAAKEKGAKGNGN